MANIIVTILEKLKITSPFKNEKADYFLMHDKDSGEVSSVPVDSILSKLNDRVDRVIYPDGFTKITPIKRVGNKVEIAAYDFEWRIQLNPYTNNFEFEKTLDPTTSPVFKRIDSLAVTPEGTIIYYKGQEDEFVIQAPDIPTDYLRLTDLTVFGDELQDHTEPFIGEVFTLAEKEKLGVLSLIASTDDVSEGAHNKYSTLSLVMSYVLTGLSFATGTSIVSTDTVLVAFGKLQKQITDLVAAVNTQLIPQITIITSVNITTATNDASGNGQKGRNVIISNGSSAINVVVNGGVDFVASYLKHGTGAITFVQGSGRTLVQVDATAVLNGAVGSTATISSVGTTDYLRISNS